MLLKRIKNIVKTEGSMSKKKKAPIKVSRYSFRNLSLGLLIGLSVAWIVDLADYHCHGISASRRLIIPRDSICGMLTCSEPASGNGTP